MERAELTEATCVADLRESRLNTYREMPNDISSHYNDEGENEENYYGRFAYELIQNADDAVGKTTNPDNPRTARFELQTGEDPVLIVSNTGPPIDAADTRALTTIGDTTKRDADRKATIGHKGRGFSSVLEITEDPYVFSTDVSFMFDRERSRGQIQDVLAGLPEWDMEDIAGIPLMRLPFAPDHRPDRVEELLAGEYETVFYFPLRTDAIEDVQRSLTALDDQTVLFLHNLARLEVVIDGQSTTWDIERTSGVGIDIETDLTSTIERVTIRHDSTADTAETTYLKLIRDAIPIGEHTAGISNNTWGDVTETQVSVAVRIDTDRRGQQLHLVPVKDDPRAHVFLPTKERSPVPLLVNGAFDSNLARTTITLTDRERDYNRFLIRQAAEIISTDLVAIARTTATTAPEFLSCLDFTTWADPESRDANTFRDELIRALQEQIAEVACIPLGDPPETNSDTTSVQTTGVEEIDTCEYVAPTEILLPSVLADAREEVIDVVTNWGARHIQIAETDPPVEGYFPAPELLTAANEPVPAILRTLGASEFPATQFPRLLPALPAGWDRLDQYPPGPQRTAIDPVVELFAAVWPHLDDDEQETFRSVAQTQPLAPVAVSADDGTVTRVRAAETELYIPPEDFALDVEIPGVQFLLEYVYRPRGRLGSQALPPAVEHRQSVIKQVWQPDPFQFEELVRTTVTPRLSEGDGQTDSTHTGSPAAEDETATENTFDIQLLALLRELGAETADPAEPLPLQDRYDEQPLYRLCRLPVPTQTQGWCPAHRVYFGAAWHGEDGPRSVGQLFEVAGIDAPMLAAPADIEQQLRSAGIELDDGIDKAAWTDFLRWIGVTPHLRLRPFFDPTEQRQFSATVARGGVERPSNGGSVLGDLDRDSWTVYRDHLEDALDSMAAGRQQYDSIYCVNSFEYWDTLRDKARTNTAVGEALIDHLIAWWEPVFSDHRDAVLATHKVGGFGGRNSSSQSSDELRHVGTNLWLWQLQTSVWCPSTRGPVAPDETWDPPERGSNPFALGEHSLLPILKRSRDPAANEAQPLLDELGIRRHLSAETFTPQDAHTVCTGLADACQADSVEIADSLRDIQPIYRQIQDLAPPVDEPLPDDSPWQEAHADLVTCPILCRVEDSFAFYDAQDAYFARSPSVRADYPFDDLPFFVLEEQRAARFGEYFGVRDFTAMVSIDGEPIDIRSDQTTAVKQHLAACAPYILCRLEAERPSQRLIDQDLARMQSALERLTVVDTIEVTYTLASNDGGQRETTTTTDFYLQTRTDGAVEERYPYIAYRDHDREQWQLLARLLCAYLDVTQFEGIDALLSAASDEERRRYLQYANAPASPRAVEQKRQLLTDDDTPTQTEFGTPTPVTDTTEEDLTDDSDTGEDTERTDTTSEEGSTTDDGQSGTPTTELYDESELRVAGTAIVVEPDPSAETGPDSATGADGGPGELPDADPETIDPEVEGDTGALSETASTETPRDQSQYDVEDLGMALAKAWEVTRLRREYPDCPDPEAYVFRVDERHLVEQARDGNGEHALDRLETEAGIPEHFPGFDLLTVNPETHEPDRLIELKASTCRRRKPSVSWNEWTTARNEWIQSRDEPLYYLYVVGHLSKTTGPEPYIRTIANPFRLLDAQIEHDVSVSQSVQVDIDAFSEESLAAVSDSQPVLEIPVETDGGGGESA